ncbi:hypothetical protein BCR41DRAFT_348889, partial [Lobosporangium transversale]
MVVLIMALVMVGTLLYGFVMRRRRPWKGLTVNLLRKMVCFINVVITMWCHANTRRTHVLTKDS